MGEIFRKPNVLVIGLPKSGTSWLYSLLREHPEINMYPLFKEPRILAEKWLFGKKNFFERMLGKDRYFHLDRVRIQRNASKLIFNRNCIKNRKEITWLFKYALYERSYKTYSSLFNQSEKYISVDISPIYSRLDDFAVKDISHYFPDMKIIILLRDPIQRAWSEMKMVISNTINNKLDSSIPFDYYLSYYDSVKEDYLNYVNIVERWTNNFSGRVYVDYYESICEDHKNFYYSICSFLNIEPKSLTDELLYKKVNQGVALKMPDQVKDYLVNLYKPYFPLMKYKFKNAYTSNWFYQYS